MRDPANVANLLSAFLDEVRKSEKTADEVKLDVVLFIDRVVEIVEQAFREIHRIAVELKYIPDSALTLEGVQRYRREAEHLRNRDKYRDVDFICGRLHVLRTQFHQEGYDTLAQGFGEQFRELVYLIDEREGELIRIVQGFMFSVYPLLERLEHSVGNLAQAKEVRDQLREDVAQRIPELEGALTELHEVHNRILPAVGGPGLIEILARDRSSPPIEIDASQHISVSGGGDYVGGNQKKAGRDLYDAAGNIDVAKEESINTIDEARNALLSVVDDFPRERREIVRAQIDKLVDAINRKSSPSEIAKKAQALEMFLESGKELLTAPARAGMAFVKRLWQSS